jgi:catechol 2,3-dioxygenase-like lactoylglutathione lyase family enzyme
MRVEAVHHVQLAMPPGGEPQARAFYRDLLGIPEVGKPASLAARGGCWFERAELRLHLGVEADFRAARKAHPALLVRDLNTLLARLRAAGHLCQEEESPGQPRRAFTEDPFGNRIELIDYFATPAPAPPPAVG